MAVHPLFQEIVDAHLKPRPYTLYDDAQWPELPDCEVVTDDGGAAYVVDDVAARDRELDDIRERLHDPSFSFRR